MESAIKYILVVTYGGQPTIDTESDVADMHKFLVDARRSCSLFQIINAQRCVIISSGNVTFTEIRIDFDEDGMLMHDKYSTLIDRYTTAEPEPPKKYIYRMRRWESWQTFFDIEADSEEEAYAIAGECYDGEYEAIEGDCIDGGTEIIGRVEADDRDNSDLLG